MEHEREGQARGQRPGGGTPATSPLRPAALMVVAGVVLVAAGLLVGDERWQLVAWILGGTTGAVGLLTLGYNRIERNAPLGRSPRRG